MHKDVLPQILSRFGVEAKSIDVAQKGYRNNTYRVIDESARAYNLIVFKKEPNAIAHIRLSNSVGQFLHDRGLPVRRPVDTRILKLFKGSPPTYAGLYNYLPGGTIPWEAYTRQHLLELGKMFSDMHEALADYKHSKSDPQTHETYALQLERMSTYFKKPGVTSAMKSKLGLSFATDQLSPLQKLLEVVGNSSNKQMLHMDFVRGNVLFDDQAEITGVIDFEKASIGHPVLDVARTLAFLLVDCKHKNALDVQKAFFYSGYQKRGSRALPRIVDLGCDRTTDILTQLVGLFLLHDFYKFLLHNPYESLLGNEHYVRTATELLKRNILSS